MEQKKKVELSLSFVVGVIGLMCGIVGFGVGYVVPHLIG